MRAFVTGATGLLGNNLVRQLIAEGHSVTALVRSRERAARLLGGLDVRLVEGDIADVAGFAPALAGHDTLFHAAAYFREYFQPGNHWGTLQALNIDATIALLRAAEAQGVRRAVHTSSSGVMGRPADGRPADEQTPPDALVHSNLYFRSKLLAEQAIDGFLRSSTLPVVLVRPGWMFGPGDAAPTSAGQIVVDFLSRRLPLIIPGGGCPTDARDVAAAMVRAAEHGQSGQRYVLGVERYISFAELFGMLAELSGVPGPRAAIPYWAALGYAATSEAFGRLTGRPVLATVAGIRSLRDPRPLAAALAVRELGASFRPLRDTMRDTIAWFRAQRPELAGSGAPATGSAG